MPEFRKNHYTTAIKKRANDFEYQVNLPVPLQLLHSSNFSEDFMNSICKRTARVIASNLVTFQEVMGKLGTYEFRNRLSNVDVKFDKVKRQFILKFNGICDFSKESIDFLLANTIAAALERDQSRYQDERTWDDAAYFKNDDVKNSNKENVRGERLIPADADKLDKKKETSDNISIVQRRLSEKLARADLRKKLKQNKSSEISGLDKNSPLTNDYADQSSVHGNAQHEFQNLLSMLSSEKVYLVNNLVNTFVDNSSLSNRSNQDTKIINLHGSNDTLGTVVQNSLDVFPNLWSTDVNNEKVHDLSKMKALLSKFKSYQINKGQTLSPEAYKAASDIVDYFIISFSVVSENYSISEAATIVLLLANVVQSIRSLYNLNRTRRTQKPFNVFTIPTFLHHGNFKQIILDAFDTMILEHLTQVYAQADVSLGNCVTYITKFGEKTVSMISVPPTVALETFVKKADTFVGIYTEMTTLRAKLTDCLNEAKYNEFIKYMRLCRLLDDTDFLDDSKLTDCKKMVIKGADIFCKILFDTVDDDGKFIDLTNCNETVAIQVSDIPQALKSGFETFHIIAEWMEQIVEALYGVEVFEAWRGCSLTRMTRNNSTLFNAISREAKDSNGIRLLSLTFYEEELDNISTEELSDTYSLPHMLPKEVDLHLNGNIINQTSMQNMKFSSKYAIVNGDYSDLLDQLFRIQRYYTSICDVTMHYRMRSNEYFSTWTIIPNGVSDISDTFAKDNGNIFDENQCRTSSNTTFTAKQVYVLKRTEDMNVANCHCYNESYVLSASETGLTYADVIDLLFVVRSIDKNNQEELIKSYYERIDQLTTSLFDFYPIRDFKNEVVYRTKHLLLEPGSTYKLIDPISYGILSERALPPKYLATVHIPSCLAKYVDDHETEISQLTESSFPAKPIQTFSKFNDKNRSSNAVEINEFLNKLPYEELFQAIDDYDD